MTVINPNAILCDGDLYITGGNITFPENANFHTPPTSLPFEAPQQSLFNIGLELFLRKPLPRVKPSEGA